MTPEQMEAMMRQIEAAQQMMAGLPPHLRAQAESQLQTALAGLSVAAAPEEQQLIAGLFGRGSSGEAYLAYRGDIRGIAAVGGSVVFVTVHPEGQPTAVFRLDAATLKLTEIPLPTGGAAITAAGDHLYAAGTDRRVYALGKKDAKPLGDPVESDIRAILAVSGDRLAVVNGSRVDLLSRNDGSVTQTLELSEVGTCIAADRTGQWLAVGTEKGTVAVFDGQDKPAFELSESDKLHDGAVTALLFEPEELRFFSAGADHKLLTTHARGKLEAEDKGRDNGHDDLIVTLIPAPGDRFLSGGRDAVVKSWPRAGGVKPVALKDGVGKVVGLATVTLGAETRLAVACDDNSVRFFKLNDDGRIGEQAARVYGAIDWAKNELGQPDAKRRDKALKAVAAWNDSAGLDLIAAQIDRDGDHAVRLGAAKLLTESANPRAVGLLEKAIGHADEKVRAEAFRGLQKHLGAADFRPIDLALKTGKPDVGILAVKALEPLAAADDQALARLTDALNAPTWDVRKAALAGLETVFPGASPEASLIALAAGKSGDVRAAALVRTFERKQLDDPRVASAIRRRLEDDDATVRRVAFLLSVKSRPNLAWVLRGTDAELHRQLNELEKSDKPAEPAPSSVRGKLTPDDFDVPLQSTACRALDTCLRGAKALAVLGDGRAFGLLIQLSREENVPARVEVCRALAALGDPRAVARLRSLLYDADASVRDAAYTALAKIEAADPLAVAGAGLRAAAEDVRRRGLQTLVETLRKAASDAGLDLLAVALNDPAAGVRSEAWKAARNLNVGKSEEGTLRFALRSVHADVRREVLTETTARPTEPWATPLLYEFLNDPDPALRREAFEFATKKSKDLAPLEAALGSRFPDARRLAIDALDKKRTKAAQALLTAALHDPDRDLRQLALTALVDEDVLPALKEAAANEHADVRVRAAAALARHGDPAGYQPLLDLATAPEPAEKDKIPAWVATTDAALRGLAELGDPAAVAPVRWLLASPHAGVRKAAAEALAWCSRADAADGLRQALSHADVAVRNRAAFGLALLGDGSVLSQLQSDEFAKDLGAGSALAATVALGPAAGDRLAVFLDHPEESVRDRALLVQVLLELAGNAVAPGRCLEALSARGPRFRLTAAQGLEAFADFAAFREFVGKLVNDRGDEKAWKVAPETVAAVAAALAWGSPLLRARVVRELAHFDAKEQHGWDLAWAGLAKRFAGELSAAAATAARPRPPLGVTAADLRELAFGAYVGLVREQGSATASPAVVRVRQTALSRVFAIASADPGYARAARPVLVQALGDPNQPVRTQAFDHLLALGTDPTRLGAEALESGHTDLGVKGLELLSGAAAAGDGDAVLERVMLARTDDLATEAAKLLVARRGAVPVATAALGAAHEALRRQAVAWLADEFEKSDAAKAGLRAAVGSRYRKVRESATLALARKKDPAAFDPLVALLRDAQGGNRQTKLIESLVQFGDKRAAAAFLDRVETDPDGTAQVADLIAAAGNFRDPATADRLFALAAAKKNLAPDCFQALLTVSGFDQEIDDPEDERPDRKWEADQHPRHPAIFAKLLDRAIAAGQFDFAAEHLDAAKWCRGPEVDEPLALLTANPDDDLRHSAIEAFGWRVRKRGAAPDPLLKALRTKNPTTQFYAAEALALAGRGDGATVLLSAIEYLDDVDLRERAVLALGELGDSRALDVLLRLAGEDGHALQEAAAEAIGHLRRGADADKIGKLLERLAKGYGGVAHRALVGLRWFDSDTGWQLIRQRAADRKDWQVRQTAAEQLGFRDEPANRDLLLKLLRTDDDGDVTQAAFASARRLFGADSLDPHFALLQHEQAGDWATDADDFGEDVIDAVCKRADPLRIMEVFPRCGPDVQAPLEASLLGRAEIPVKAAVAALASTDEGTVRLAARLLARSGSADKSAQAAVEKALDSWWKTWQDRRAKLARDRRQADPLARAADCVGALVWAAGRLGAGLSAVADLAVSRPDDGFAKPVRLAAVRCLASVPPTDVTLTALELVARGTDADARELAAAVLARHDPKRAAAVLDALVSDGPSFGRLLSGQPIPEAEGFAKAAAGQVHVQPVALPHLIAAKDVGTLAAVARDRKQPEPARLGAVEALGVMADPAAEAVLVGIGTTDGDDEDVRKAAWKALRRSKRKRKQAVAAG